VLAFSLLEAEESTSTESSLTESNPGDSLSANEEQVDEHEQIFRVSFKKIRKSDHFLFCCFLLPVKPSFSLRL